MFNIAQAIKTVAMLTRQGGYVIHLNPMSGYVNHGFYSISPEFYISFYENNGFAIEDMRAEFIFDDNNDPKYWESFFSRDLRLFENWIDLRNYISKLATANKGGRVLNHCVAKKMRDDIEYTYPIQRVWLNSWSK